MAPERRTTLEIDGGCACFAPYATPRSLTWNRALAPGIAGVAVDRGLAVELAKASRRRACPLR
jgi:hypothetical protein